ncbi:hypothetical protein EVAR_44654_1 [Eumeta japonica]|uniref:Uncharacterized protein n=1 Tax=Eumeta variegata TaxID=151549 RepID=A0A4C1XEE0_EUMVA|nr:hypothetical protein EVAR_44654_1 [Eumeta japonica]
MLEILWITIDNLRRKSNDNDMFFVKIDEINKLLRLTSADYKKTILKQNITTFVFIAAQFSIYCCYGYLTDFCVYCTIAGLLTHYTVDFVILWRFCQYIQIKFIISNFRQSLEDLEARSRIDTDVVSRSLCQLNGAYKSIVSFLSLAGTQRHFTASRGNFLDWVYGMAAGARDHPWSLDCPCRPARCHVCSAIGAISQSLDL